MNNLEKLLKQYENGEVRALSSLFADKPCKECPAESYCNNVDGGCFENIASWLLQEYVEHDSWEKIEEDATKMYSDYWKCADIDCDTCSAVFKGFLKPYEYYDTDGFSVAIKCANAQKCDLVSRAKKLAGVE